MIVAAIALHWQNGWLAMGKGAGFFAIVWMAGVAERLEKAKEILQADGNNEWLTVNGSIVILNNGFEFAATFITSCY